MTATAEQIAANRANSAKSTGPVTEEGKAASRVNGLKHGMTGQGFVLPQEATAEVDRRTARLTAEMNPKTEQGRILIGRMAVNSYRMERAFLEESASTSIRIAEAQAEVDLLEIADPAQAAEARKVAATLALFDYSKDAQLARRYEANAERNYYKAKKEYDKVEAPPVVADEPDTDFDPVRAYEELASSYKFDLASFEAAERLRPAAPIIPLPMPEPAPAEPAWMPKPSQYPKLPNDLSDISSGASGY